MDDTEVIHFDMERNETVLERIFLAERTKIHLVPARNRECLFLDNCDSVCDFLFLFLLCLPNLGRVTPKVKSVRKLSEDDVVA